MSGTTFDISVIVPVHNGEEYLRSCLCSVRQAEDMPRELIVVDDASTDHSAEVAREYADKVFLLTSRQGAARARNRGVAESRGSVLLFVDADVGISPETLSIVHDEMAANPEIGALFGGYDDTPSGPGFASQYKNLFHHFVHQHGRVEAATFWTGCGAVRRDIFLASRGFLSPSIEDVEFGYRLHRQGVRIRQVRRLQVTHLKRYSIGSLIRSDVFSRAVPWTRLAFHRGLPRDLNFKLSDRVSGVAALLLALCFCLIPFGGWTVAGTACSLGILLFVLNFDLYNFFLNKRGIRFAVAAVLFHWLYLFYSSVVFAGLSTVLWGRALVGDGPVCPWGTGRTD